MSLCQFFTPLWVAEALIERHFPKLDAYDLVLEPSCGHGAFLMALPANVPAVGIDVDAIVAAEARAVTGRRIIEADFTTVALDFRPTAIIGNPPFRMGAIDKLIRRCEEWLPDGGRAGFILPAYAFRTAERVVAMLDVWSITQELLPRSAFAYRMREPLVFAILSKDGRRTMVGFALYEEETDRQGIGREYRDLLSSCSGSKWRAVCELALRRLGGTAPLSAIYGEIERNRPSRTEFWREKIRQTLRAYTETFTAIEVGRYSLRTAA